MKDRIMLRDTDQLQIRTAVEEEGFSLILVGGAPGLGKAKLVRESLKGLPGVFLTVPEVTEPSLKAMWQNYVSFEFEDWDQFFRSLGDEALQETRVLVLRHSERLFQAMPEVEGALRRALREHFPKSSLKLILIDDYRAEAQRANTLLRGFYAQEASLKLTVRPLDYRQSLVYLKHWAPQDALYAYAITEGCDRYLQVLARYNDLKTAVIEEILHPEGGLRERPEAILAEYLREPHVYNALLLAMANGAFRQKDLAEAAAIHASSAANYLRVLLDLGLIQKELPYKSNNPRLLRYSIEEPLLNFTYHFLPRLDPLCQRGLLEEAYRILKEQLPRYFARAFKMIARDYLLNEQKAGRIAGRFEDFAPWWNDAGQTVDLLGSDANTALFATCLWSEQKMDQKELDNLKKMARLTQRRKNKLYYLFSGAGFTDDLLALAKEEDGVQLISLFGEA